MTNYDENLFETLVKFGQLHVFLEKINRGFAAGNGLSMMSVAILFYLQRYSNVSNSKLATDLGQDSIRVSKRVRKLYELGLLRQNINKDDRRFVKLSLTDEGQSKVKMIQSWMKENSSVNTDVLEIIHLITQLSNSVDNLNNSNR